MTTAKTLALKSLVASTLIALAASSLLAADSIVFDPDDGGNAGRIDIGTFQFGAGNLLAVGAIGSTAGSNVQLLFQSQLNSVVTAAGTQITPSGLNASTTLNGVAPYEVTAVFSVTERVINVRSNPARILYNLAKVQASGSFVEMYYDPNRNADPLQGTGYNDGILVLRGTPVAADPDAGTFTLTDSQPIVLPSFDKFTVNDYANTSSNIGIGGTRFDVSITYVDPNFFPAPVSGNTGRQVHVGDILTFNIGQSTPFDQVNPSHKFDAVANAGSGSGPAPGATPRVGGINGTSGPDLQMQALAAVSISAALGTTPTPTPTPTPTVTPSPTVTPTPGQLRVSVAASKPQVHEGHGVTITFAVNQTTHPAIAVHYTTAGSADLNTDYTLSGTQGTVVIAANAASATIDLAAIADSVKEPNGETAKIILSDDPAYQVSSAKGKVTVTILD
jgi:hypothetical protein